ncbi:hypothetical protein GQF61_13475 [Sphingobacterium sp. DK4209]|uniref:Uncharacterized protein n=1 Tax=Sphingobacterium zhuxiongii TaxID=2662364 RepID=A0A5Q0QBG1_9SPHI|nr:MULTISPECIES: hypothetical protein [unclassified Sphingobacterium]MVZ66867.1 hypothetical protein [Sphingobacterium sp. DK4209]QGA26211.1 hypothetical protein GFH32_07680 [Sphingobacterium sp. dk4302]
MQTKTEYLIWDKIVSSAKSRFDAELYANKFKNMQPELFDKLVLHIIVGFASGEEHETISTNLHNELEHLGIDVREGIIDTIVSDKHILFSPEIYAAYLTFSMLEDGSSEAEVLGYVCDLLENPHIY